MLIRNFVFWLSSKKSVTRVISDRGMRYGFARRFIAGETLAECLAASRELNRLGRRISLNHLGEDVSSVEEAHRVRDGYIEMLHALVGRQTAATVAGAPLDGNISIKLTQLGLTMPAGGRDLCLILTEEIVAAAEPLGLTIEMDMEGSAHTDATLEIFEAVTRRHRNTCLAIQAYLYRTEKDLERLAPLEPKIRLVKGAYREPVRIAWQKQSEVDDSYRRLLSCLLDGKFTAAIATHDPAMQEYARALLAERGTPREKYEFQMIYGIRRDLHQQACDLGHPLRIYVPFGTEWCPYFMRRLSERPANCWFVLRSLAAESLGPGRA